MADKNKKGRAGSFIVGTVAGAVIGSLAALLFAPKSGKEFRKDLKSAAHGISKRLLEVRKELLAKAKEAERKIAKSDVAKDVKARTKKAVREAKELADRLERQAKHFQKYGEKVKKDAVKETRDLVNKSAETLRELKSVGAGAARRTVKKTKKTVKKAKRTKPKTKSRKR